MNVRPAHTVRPVIVLVAVLMLVATTTAAAALTGVPADEAPYVDALRVADAPLVADAGDSGYARGDDPVVLHGTSFGGQAPYRYSWETEAGEIQVADSPTAVIVGAPGGVHSATLTVTDGSGTTATDTVTFVVDKVQPRVHFEDTIVHTNPSVIVIGWGSESQFDVPDDTGRLIAEVTYNDPNNDYELRLLNPNGEQVAMSRPAPGSPARVLVDDPEPGTWTVNLVKWTPFPDEASLVVSRTDVGDHLGDPRPTVDAGGTYNFVVGEEQRLTGTVAGDAASTAWDLNLDGVFETPGSEVVADLPPGRHLVSFRATTAEGHTARQMTSVLVGTSQEEVDRLATPITTIGFADSGINPYHLEFSAATYPDPEVLELTRNFTRHPSEYIPGYPKNAKPLPITLGEGYFPEQDSYIWDPDDRYIQAGQVYWIPGTKIVGAIDAGGYSGSIFPFLDDNGHGTGSASVAAGNRYGYCPTCLIVAADSLSGGSAMLSQLDWLDINNNSWGYTGGAPLGLAFGPDQLTKQAAERGQTILFSAGNGMGNTFFDVPILTYGSDYSGPDWVITVGAIREDNQGAIISDGMPAHVSNLGDGDLPSACRVGDTAQCAFSGTSAASPYTAGVFGHVLTEIRRALGDHAYAGQRPGQVVAQGTPIEGSEFLADGTLTRQELRAAVLKVSAPRYDAEPSDRFYPLPQHWNLPQAHYVFEGYGSPGPAAAKRAIEVLLGQAELPDRSEEDAFFLEDCWNRDMIYGQYDRNGDGTADSCDDESEAVAFTGSGELTNDDPRDSWFHASRDAIAQDTAATEPITYWLHRRAVYAPGDTPPADEPTESGGPCAERHNEAFLSRTPAEDGENVDTCFDDRITSTVAPYRPKGIFAAKDVLTAPLPAGSQVDVTAYMKSGEPTVTELVAVLKATDREIGRSDRVVLPTNPASWAEFTLTLETLRPVAAGEQLTLHFVHAGARAYAYGYDGDAASSFTITPAAQPDGGLEFGVTIASPEQGAEIEDATDVTVDGLVAFPDLGPDPQLAGFHPVSHAVQVSVGDPDFREPVYAQIDPEAGTYSATLYGLGDGEQTLYVRALRDRYASTVETVTVTVGETEADHPGKGKGPRVEPPRGKPDAPPAPGRADGPRGSSGEHVLGANAAASDHPATIALALVALLLAGTALARTTARERARRST